MATYLNFFNTATNRFEGDELTVDASFTATGVWHDGLVWYFITGSTIWRYLLVDGVFRRDSGVDFSSQIPQFKNNGKNCIVGDQANIYVGHDRLVVRDQVASPTACISLFSKTDLKFVEIINEVNLGIADSGYTGITTNGAQLFTWRLRDPLSGTKMYRKTIFNIASGALENATETTTPWLGIAYDQEVFWVTRATGRVNRMRQNPSQLIGPVSLAGPTTQTECCLVMDGPGEKQRSSAMIATIRN